MIIKSLLDTDLYKFTMHQAVFHQYPKALVEYKFICRNNDVDLRPYKEEIESEIIALCELSFKDEEIKFLGSLGFFKEDYLNYLKNFKLNCNHVHIKNSDKLEIRVKGSWLETIHFEVLVLAIVNEVYFRNTQKIDYNLGRAKLSAKIELIKNFNEECKNNNMPIFWLSDFGTRRRISSDWQGEVDSILKTALPENFSGTSSVYWAMKNDLRPIGTMAHEYLQAHQVLASSLEDSQKETFQSWLKEYPDVLGIALSDIYGTDAFIRDWNSDLANKFQGTRHDSGNPYIWGDKLLAHYNKLGIDPRTKIFVFSDGLDIPKALDIHRYFSNKVMTTFGIGTNITNDFNFKAINIVMKMVVCNGQPVCKISDEPGKAICEDPAFLTKVKKLFKVIDGDKDHD